MEDIKKKSNRLKELDRIFYLFSNLSILEKGYSEINALTFHFWIWFWCH